MAPGLGWADGVALCALVRAAAPPSVCGEVPPSDAAARAAGPAAAVTAALAAAFAAGVPAWFSVEGITSANARLQTAVIAQLMRAAPALNGGRPRGPPPPPAAAAAAAQRFRRVSAPPSAPTIARLIGEISASLTAGAGAVAVDPAALDPAGGSLAREARALAAWANGLHVTGVTLRGGGGAGELARDLREGVPLLRLLDVAEPGLVNWARVSARPRPGGRVKAVENCSVAVNLGRAMDFSLRGVSGLELADAVGGGRPSLALLWQVARAHMGRALGALATDGFAPTDADILAWANERIADAVAAGDPKQNAAGARLPSLRDPEWGSGLHLLYLLEALRPGCVAWDAVTEGTTPQEQEANARYLASLALLLGVPGPALAWQDVVAVKPRAILLFLAGAWLLAAGIRRLKEGDKEDEGSDDEDSEEE